MMSRRNGNVHGLKINEWHSLEAKQIKLKSTYNYSICIDGKELFNIENTKPQIFQPMKIYFGDPDYAPQPGFVRNVYVNGKYIRKYLYVTCII